jgi:hypothetical protein
MPPKTREGSDTPSRATPFQTKHLVEFGLEITQSDLKGLLRTVVTCVGCFFCKRFGRVNAADDNESFLDTKKRVQDSIHRYMNAYRTALMIPLAKDIVEVIIGEVFFKPDLDEDNSMMEPITKINALKLFHQQLDESYLAKVSNPALFDLVLKHTLVDLSFTRHPP